MTALYHYTNTARLPWILADGALKPGRARIGDFPPDDFLWATDLPIIDRTSSSAINGGAIPADKRWMLRDVRFTLRRDDFASWAEVRDDLSGWTLDQVQRLERAAQGRSSPKNWYVRVDPLVRDRWTAVETRGARDKDWLPLDPATDLVEVAEYLGVVIGGLLYASQRGERPTGEMGYGVLAPRPWPPTRQQAA